MPLFNGLAIFGPCPVFRHTDTPNAEQINHYPGVNGVERLDLGLATSITRVTGILVGVDLSDLGSQFATIRAMKAAGFVATLVDSKGLIWPDAVLHSFGEVDRISGIAGYGVGQEYEMEFLHVGYNPNS